MWFDQHAPGGNAAAIASTGPGMLLLRLALMAALLAGPAPARAAGEAEAVARVTNFLTAAEAVMAGPGEDRAQDRVRELQYLYRDAFDMPALAARTAPDEFWGAATDAQRARFTAVLLCRLAVATVTRGGVEGGGSWEPVGTRARTGGMTVAVRFQLEHGGQRTALFDLAGDGAAARVVEVRSEAGRLSARLAEEIRREAGEPGADTAAWLEGVRCVLRGR
jgi:hypothetical protein